MLIQRENQRLMPSGVITKISKRPMNNFKPVPSEKTISAKMRSNPLRKNA